ncbi:MAG: hypothetical protein K0S30_82 [Clostridia bacterium]|jgi:4'-phosphopantetheinyl transferase|nr:hypothetical protein [Clostridia bacterium]
MEKIDRMSIYAVKITDSKDNQLINTVVPRLSLEVQEKIKRLKRKEDKMRSVIGQLLIRTAVCEELCARKVLLIEKTPYGKPFLKEYPSIHFNLSHSGQWVVCVVHYLPVGIDIEKMEEIDLGFIKEILTQSEYRQIANNPEEKIKELFYEIWVAKESAVKALGKGLYMPFNQFEFLWEDKKYTVLPKDYTHRSLYFKQYRQFQGYKLAVCAYTEDFPDKIILKQRDQLLDNFLAVNSMKKE